MAGVESSESSMGIQSVVHRHSSAPSLLAMATMDTKQVDIFDLITKPKRRGRPRKHTDFNTICANKLDEISQFEIQQLIEAKRMSQVNITHTIHYVSLLIIIILYLIIRFSWIIK